MPIYKEIAINHAIVIRFRFKALLVEPGWPERKYTVPEFRLVPVNIKLIYK